jgi:outer membrane protein OmpA-like peptidoglycan-associated protein
MRRGLTPFAMGASVGLLLGTLTACGGVTQFSDTTPIVLASPVPPPPPPPAEPPRVEVKKDRIVINEKIQFAIDKADILPVSHGLLNEVVSAIQSHAEIKKVGIHGHTDDDGDEKYNQGLSERRAKSVLDYFVQHGVESARLQAKGFGESQPIADNTTVQGREQNRRVEFLILEQEGVQ